MARAEERHGVSSRKPADRQRGDAGHHHAVHSAFAAAARSAPHRAGDFRIRAGRLRLRGRFHQFRILPVALELLDRTSINAIEDYEPSGLPRNAGALLVIEVDGLREAIAREAEIVREMCHKHRAIQFREAGRRRRGDAIWEVRRKMSPAVARTGKIKLNHDAVVPRSRIPAMLDFIEELGRDTGFLIPTFGHAGDGNHINVMLQDDDEATRRRGAETVRRVFESGRTGRDDFRRTRVGYAKAPSSIWRSRRLRLN